MFPDSDYCIPFGNTVLSGVVCPDCVFRISASFSKRNDRPRKRGIVFRTHFLVDQEPEICPICGNPGIMVEFECVE